MTIFLDIAKHFLVEVINRERKRAKSSNESYIGSKTRDLSHSAKKIGLARQLREEIKNFEDLGDDQTNWLALKHIIFKYQKANNTLCQAADFEDGELRSALIDTNALLDGIYFHVFESNNLLNINPDLNPVMSASSSSTKTTSPSTKYSDAFDKFLYYSAYYLVQKYRQPEEQTIVQSYWRSLPFSGSVKVGTEKLSLLEQTMATLNTALESSEEDREQYQIGRKGAVLLALNAILGGNISLCHTHSFQPILPVSGIGVGFIELKLPTWEPATGELKDTMTLAYKEIAEMQPIKRASKIVSKVPDSPPKPQTDLGQQEPEAQSLIPSQPPLVVNSSNAPQIEPPQVQQEGSSDEQPVSLPVHQAEEVKSAVSLANPEITLFIDIVKNFLVEMIDKERKRAKEANESYIGSKVRNLDHSEKKRSLVKDLREEIKQFKGLENDENSWLALKRILFKYQRSNMTLCQEAEINEGTLRTVLINANSLVDGIYFHVFALNNLLNIHPDINPDIQLNTSPPPESLPMLIEQEFSPCYKYNDAFDKFLYYCASFFVLKYKEPDQEGLAQSYWKSLTSGTAAKVKADVKTFDLLAQTIDNLHGALESSDQQKILYRMGRKGAVLLALNAILGGSTSLLLSYGYQPITPRLALPIWEPATGVLKEEMTKAYKEINTMVPPDVRLADLPQEPHEEPRQEQKQQIPPIDSRDRRMSAPVVSSSVDDSVEKAKKKDRRSTGSLSIADVRTLFSQPRAASHQPIGERKVIGIDLNM
ncbi:hypothetical protein BN59_00585 [Legionella massiliensis]|uniref:Uncharacterized protein n=1 Tax=Legionella massiliensis TaxID=1034943 RepID=A0A078KX97_9GAMM|nr:hypothetical protein [Legionella massiliensis]CDZ76318.1 hypothetical protein BN59_00585 [Legionella massiliensis]CEE12056.1 hypothetical protein BN1094_00585 [Legionella massiliensis]